MTGLLLVALACGPTPADEVALLRTLAQGAPPAAPAVDVGDRTAPPPLGDLPLDADTAAWVAWYAHEPLTVTWLARLDRHRPLLADALLDVGLPTSLAVVPVVESGLLADAVSTRGAAGWWQLMPATAHDLGLAPDDRLDPARATPAAARYLASLFRDLGRYDLALTAYNAGPGTVRAAMAATGGTTRAELVGVLSPEARHYVPRLHAVALLDAHRELLQR